MIPIPVLRAIDVTNLRCENLTNPTIDEVRPRLSWVIESDYRRVRQTAYQVLVASTKELLAKDHGDLWDSGAISSDQNDQVEYAGKPLESRSRCYWKVRVWATTENAWSQTAFWGMGLLKPEDFQAKWITASKWFMPPNLRPRGLVVNAGGWADVDLGQPCPIDSIKLYFLVSKTAPKRFKILGADNMQFVNPHTLVDQTASDYQWSDSQPQVFAVNGAKFRHIRLWITSTPDQDQALIREVQTWPLSPPTTQVVVRQMEVMSGGRNVALMRPAREFGTQWANGHAPFLVDGMPSEKDGNQCPSDACLSTAAPLLRKTFTVQKPVKRATMYIAALGMADVTINGQPVTNDVLGPPFTDYTKRVAYRTHDVTALLSNDENVIGTTLGNGFFSTPSGGYGQRHGGHGPVRMLIQTEIEFVDGSREIIPSDDTWKWTQSEIIFNDTFYDYTEDRRQAKPGWDRSGYDDHDWHAVAVTNALGGKLVPTVGPPIRVVGELKPDRVKENRAFFTVLTTGWPRVQVNGKAGQTITIVGHAPSYKSPPLKFTLAKNGPSVLEPRFMYLSGPLEVEVLGLSEPLAHNGIAITTMCEKA
jgi:alpha-L-rhamnosidase